ncbi:MAG: DHH family phosphoesterase [Anaeromyxobacter sp.]
MQLKILYHGNCFDGCASAAIVSRFLSDREGARGAQVRYEPLHHALGNAFPADAFDGDVNACVDFRYSRDPRLHWWFDHHASGFPTPEDRAAYEAERSPTKFWDPKAPSCAGFIARTVAARFGWQAPELDELVRWADVIDAARFESPSTAVRLEAPALHVMTVLEATQDPALPTRVIEAMQRRPLAELAAEPWIAGPFAPLKARHQGNVEVVKKLARQVQGVVRMDLSESGITSPNKFIAYDLFPQASYVVAVTRDAKRAKVSVGSNPWARPARPHDISKICERYGGGGHPVVGAVSLEPDRIADARRIADEIADELSREPRTAPGQGAE